MAASVVDFPEPVPPTTITSPRLLSTTSFRIGGRSSSSKVGILALIRRITQPMAPCCTKALTRKRPMPAGAIAKLHSLVASNSRVCRSFMMARTSVADCSADSARSLCGRISPSILMAGGKPAVMNRSDAFFSVTRRRRSCISLMAWSRSMCVPPLLQRVHVLLLARKHVDDAVDGLGGGAGMQRAEHQVTGLGGGERQADGLQVAHLADQDHIRILAQRRAQRLAEAERVAMHLALVDETALGLVHELDRILDGDDEIGRAHV